MSAKPKLSFKDRMDHDDELWLIWSNKWSCWYRADSAGYTGDPMQAGLYSRDEALSHYNPDAPRSHRVTEPFPISAIRKQAQDAVAQAKAALVSAEQRLDVICRRGRSA